MIKEDADLFLLAVENNYTPVEAKGFVASYNAIIGENGSPARDRYLTIKNSLNLQIYISLDKLRAIGVYYNSRNTDEQLWELGFNTKQYGQTLDVGCFEEDGRVICGVFVVGQERTDDEWVEKVVDGRHVASMRSIMRNRGDRSFDAELLKLS